MMMLVLLFLSLPLLFCLDECGLAYTMTVGSVDRCPYGWSCVNYRLLSSILTWPRFPFLRTTVSSLPGICKP